MRARTRLYATANSEEYKNEPVVKEKTGKEKWDVLGIFNNVF